MSILVSFIVPIYNGEKYFCTCMDALRNQTYKHWECIIVNDGSTDSTKQLCDSYVQKHRRFKVLHTQNQGQGLARNTGLANALGEYVWFIDIDDLVEIDGLSVMVAAALEQQADIVTGLYYRCGTDKNELIGKKFSEGLVSRNTPDERKRYNQIKTSSLFGYTWNKLIRRKYLIQHELLFDDVKKLNLEDTLFNLKLFSKNPVYYLCSRAVYNYDVKNISYTRRAEPNILEMNIALIRTYYDYLVNTRVLDENLDLAVALAARVFCWTLVKNAPYEGLSYQKLCCDIEAFLMEESFYRLITQKKSIKKLFTIPSIAQSIFFCLCFFMLRLRFKKLLALLMIILYPLMRSYIVATLK